MPLRFQVDGALVRDLEQLLARLAEQALAALDLWRRCTKQGPVVYGRSADALPQRLFLSRRQRTNLLGHGGLDVGELGLELAALPRLRGQLVRVLVQALPQVLQLVA